MTDTTHETIADAIDALRATGQPSTADLLEALAGERDRLRDALSIAGPIALEDFAGHPFCYNEEERRKISVIRAALTQGTPQ